MRRTLTSLAVIAALAFPAFADDSRLLQSVSLEDLRAILTEDGYQIDSTGDDGPVSIRATDALGTGLIFNVVGTACDLEGYGPGCLGINMQVRYDADGKETLERINFASQNWIAASTYYWPEGTDGVSPTVVVARYLILDGGVTVRNVKDNLINLLAIAPQVADYVWQAGEFAPGAVPAEEDDYLDDEDYYYEDEEW